MASRALGRTDFLRLLAEELLESLEAAVVFVTAPDLAAPLLSVGDDRPGPAVDLCAVDELLEIAIAMPIACDVATRPDADPASGEGVARGLRIELTAAPKRVAMLIVYPWQSHPSPATQIDDLKTLDSLTRSAREVIGNLPIRAGADASGKPLQPAESPQVMVTPHRDPLRTFHLNLDMGQTSYRIVNESRRLLGCDRVTLLAPHRGRLRVRAISGVAVVDGRSNSVRTAERMTNHAIVLSKPLVLPGESLLPPQVQEPLDEYLDETGVATAVLLPLYAPNQVEQKDGIEECDLNPFDAGGRIQALMILEYFSDTAPASITPAMTSVASEATLSIRNAAEHEHVFGLKLWKLIGKSARAARRPLAMLIILALTAALVVAAITPVQHYVIATGTVQPTLRRQVFASVDGIIRKIHIRDGQRVAAGDPLFDLESADLESQAESIAGEIQTTSRRLASIRALRLSDDGDVRQASRLALEQRQLETELQHLSVKQEIVREQQSELHVTSPIDGTVIGWNLESRLADRPVSRGHLLVSIADDGDRWSLRLEVPDRDVGPVLEAIKENARLPVRFAVASDPESTYTATLQSVATAVRLDQAGVHVIDATASVEPIDPSDDPNVDSDPHHAFRGDDQRVGADVTAKIECGQRSALHSWFGDVVDFVHRNVLFYFR